ncbi:Phosphoserine phosphatase RsbU, N-terminal domain [Geodermatophilus pulveris]|uniref:Phosphoserine phosphatase RsbU, N-terminal domain n=1 Tax=Geodermatophilus pulveris TaxID=1564159 RepID=A0A239EIS2_9ACTN|nr:phosphatase RsbU N-terminal domain-containing protein [Geodermatophilus pulveris]SNS43774.1 Phosphoserine phosphatase RsbU, N-terminal domain [Geodermatophilus pulveris]
MSAEADLRRNYRAAFLRYLARPGESALAAGWSLGRGTLGTALSLLDIVRVHHDLLLEVLQDCPADEVPEVARAASDFLVEVLASHDMVRRPLHP